MSREWNRFPEIQSGETLCILCKLWGIEANEPQRQGSVASRVAGAANGRNRHQPVPQILVEPCQLPRRAQKLASISANGSDTDSLTASEQQQRYAEHFLSTLL